MTRPSRHGITRDEYLQMASAYAVRGNALPHARLTPDLVRQIRANPNGWTAKRWAEHLGVHLRTVEKVRARETWGWVR